MMLSTNMMMIFVFQRESEERLHEKTAGSSAREVYNSIYWHGACSVAIATTPAFENNPCQLKKGLGKVRRGHRNEEDLQPTRSLKRTRAPHHISRKGPTQKFNHRRTSHKEGHADIAPAASEATEAHDKGLQYTSARQSGSKCPG